MEKRKDAEYEGGTLRIQQQVAEAKARARILVEIDDRDKELSKNHLQRECEKIKQGYDHYDLADKLSLRALHIIVYQ